MKERPILFNAAMVQAILAGRKTQTRRALKHQPRMSDILPNFVFPKSKAELVSMHPAGFIYPNALDEILAMCPFGAVGDRLWVREAWCMGRIDEVDAEHPLDRRLYAEQTGSADDYVLHKAECLNSGADISEVVWRPSIHMPRWACRIILEITSVRVERLHNISDADAMAEGIQGFYSTGEEKPDRFGIKAEYCGYGTAGSWKFCETPVKAFEQLWYATGGQWIANPWVWVIEFKVLTTNGKVPEVAA